MLLPAVIAAGASRPVPAAGSADPDAIVYMDFVGGVYEMDQTVTTVGALLAGDFDPAYIVARGMQVPSAANAPDATPALCGRFEAMLAAGFTVVFDIDQEESGTDWPLLVASDTTDIDLAAEVLELALPDDGGFDFYGDLQFGNGTPAEYRTTGINRIGFTINRDIATDTWRSSHSINGSAATYDEVGYDLSSEGRLPTVGRLRICHISEWSVFLPNAWVRRIIFYPARDDAELAALTGLTL